MMFLAFNALIGCIFGQYLLLSTHDDKNLFAFDIHGKQLSKESLNLQGSGDIHGLRGITTSENFLWLSNSYKKNSRLLLFSLPDLKFIRDFTENGIDNPTFSGIQHPYGVAIDTNTGNVLTSCQNSECVVALDKTGAPLANITKPYPGCVIYFGHEGGGGNGVRGIATDSAKRILFVAYETGNSVQAYDLDSFKFLWKITSDGYMPVGVTVVDNVLYAGFMKGKDGDYVQAFSYTRDGFEEGKIFKEDALDHPAGLQVVGPMLLVVSQHTNQILRWNVESGDYEGEFASFDAKGEVIFWIDRPFPSIQNDTSKRLTV